MQQQQPPYGHPPPSGYMGPGGGYGPPPPKKKDKTVQWILLGVLAIPAFLIFVALLGVVLRAVGLMDSQEARAQKALAAQQQQARAAESKAAPVGPSAALFVAESQSVIGAWNHVITNSAMPNSISSDEMRHVFAPDGTVIVRMDEKRPATFTWTFQQGKFVVAYKYGQFDHQREFRLRSPDEAEVVESNGKVLDAYVREGSTLARQKTTVPIFAQVAAAKNGIDVNALVIGRSYVLDRQTALMPDPDPVDPMAALRLVKQVPPGSAFSVLGTRTVSGGLWYQIRTALGGGWFNSSALLGQDIKAK